MCPSNRKDERISPEWLRKTLAYRKYVIAIWIPRIFSLNCNKMKLSQNSERRKIKRVDTRWVEAWNIIGRL